MFEDVIKKIKEVLLADKKITVIVILGICGILLISFSEFGKKKNEETVTAVSQENETDNTDYTAELEKKLTDIISSIENAGEVKVMLTLKGSKENVYAVNENIKNDENSNNYSNTYVIIDNKNTKEGIKIKILEPEVQGVAVVCSGGDIPYVREQIINAVTTVLGIGTNKVSVSKMK